MILRLSCLDIFNPYQWGRRNLSILLRRQPCAEKNKLRTNSVFFYYIESSIKISRFPDRKCKASNQATAKRCLINEDGSGEIIYQTIVVSTYELLVVRITVDVLCNEICVGFALRCLN